MTAVDLICRLHEHRAWVNENLVEAARSLDEEALRRSFPIGQGSVWKSLLHMYAAEYVWLETLLGDEQPVVPGDLPGKIPGNQESEGAIASLDELDSKLRELGDRWQGYLQELTDGDLDDVVAKVSYAGKRGFTRRGDILLHVCTHAQYTAAQVMNMLRQLGREALPEVMLITLARQRMAQS
jgi:uncharacterized damage-inducible protein DinB